MRRNAIAKRILIFAVLLLIHCAYSGLSHRSFSKIVKLEIFKLPLDIVIELAGDFVPIRVYVQLNDKPFESFFNRPTFYSFNHRAKTLAPFYPSVKLDREMKSVNDD
ncbi:putative transmembrane protein 32 [Trichinella spiralis]|uniref:putative transmembrane protein 32 n=1 Tax=Trichinella spiralis TaxID=6334 RepID=UPI0001EFD07E|nr:putative transmembrane protein 32 [Trichinella spiralis]XP_003377648.1 putative transmembrane protein 32 [Trichinella spiralis]